MIDGGPSMSQAAPQNQIPHEAWLEECLTVEQAAEFLNLDPQWLNRARVEGNGPEYIRLSPRQILYVRRTLIKYRDQHRFTSTAEYQRGPGTDSGASEPEGGA